MNELLYQKNQAVAALNRVEGFEPLEFAGRSNRRIRRTSFTWM